MMQSRTYQQYIPQLTEKEARIQFQVWINELSTQQLYYPYNFEQKVQQFNMVFIEKQHISHDQFDQIQVLINILVQNINQQKFRQFLETIVKSQWFNCLLLDKCQYLIKQGKNTKYMRQELTKLYNLLSSLFSLIPECLIISQMSAIFQVQRIFEQNYQEFQFDDIFNNFDKFLFSILKMSRDFQYQKIPNYPISLEFNEIFEESLFGKLEKLNIQNNNLQIYRGLYSDLRKAICFFIKSGFYSDIDPDIESNIGLYQNAQLVSIGINNSDLIWGITVEQFILDGRIPKKIDWSKTKKLGNGSLICITNTQCYPLIFGIITFKKEIRSNQQNLSQKIQVEFKLIDSKYSITQVFNLFSSFTVMLQYDGLFEPVTFYLQALKQKFEIPFHKQIIQNQNILYNPSYLSSQRTYHLDLSGMNKNYKGQFINIFPLYQWPQMQTSLDQSQLDAIKYMLLHEIALVQGPPGTGKTYCGALAVRVLLNNLNRKDLPILIVCYTNHALDQFLEHILQFVPIEDVARLGGQCKNPVIQECVFRCKTQTFQFEWDQFKQIKQRIKLLLKRMLEFNYKLSAKNLKKHWPFLYDQVVSCFRQDHNLEIGFFSEKQLEYIVECWFKIQKPEERKLRLQDNNIMHNYFSKQEILLEQETKQQKQQSLINKNLLLGEIEDDFDFNLESEDEFYFNENENKFSEFDLEEEIKKFNANRQNYKNTFDYEIIEILNQEIKNQKTNPWHFHKSDILKMSSYIKILAYQTDSIKFTAAYNKFKALSQKLQDIYDQNEIKILNQKKIVGVTVTGVARQVSKLSSLNTKIMVVEEAAEVLESHVASILTKNLQHLILIGDHQQLRPTLKCYELQTKLQANISLFERLVINQIPVAVLRQQRRMKTKFADFIRQIYGNNYEDHEEIQKLNQIEVRGLESDLLFFNHKWLEAQDEKSKINYQEANMIFGMVQYLLKIQYQEQQITVLTLYLKQAQYLKKKFVNLKQVKLRVQTVDNYQGEENDIIIISLVRNNAKNKLGFINIENRINVALSRARIGMYVFGNFDFILSAAGSSSLWWRIISLAKKKQCYNDYIAVKCEPHGNLTTIMKPEDWEKIKPGLCNQKCKKTFQNCTHQCEKLCHKGEHSADSCPFRCNKILNCSHNCQLYCKEQCKCYQIVQITLPCNHEVEVVCGTQAKDITCQSNCIKEFQNCGHQQKYKCWQSIQFSKICYQICGKLLDCSHICEKKCHETCEPCLKSCNKILSCGHKNTCEKRCYETCSPCQKMVSQKLKCGHSFSFVCGTSKKEIKTYQCQKKCMRKSNCEHALKCPKLCFQECDPCMEQIEKTLTCGHSYVFDCGKQIEQIKAFQCEKKCIRERSCGHNFECKNLCKEKCTECHEVIEKKTNCGHPMKIQCYLKDEVFVCLQQCIKKRDCGHSFRCFNTCFEECTPCQQLIDYELSCGHIHQFQCYLLESSLKQFQCLKKCQKKRLCGHQNDCLNVCSLACSPCEEKIFIPLICGHEFEVFCFNKPKFYTKINCQKNCTKFRQCGHSFPCTNLCFDECSPCEQLINHQLPCGHSQQFQCFKFNAEVTKYLCQNQCQRKRSCGHLDICLNKCSDPRCSPCKQTIKVDLSCGHIYKIYCSQLPVDKNIIQCIEDCNKIRSCGHSFPCSKKCFEVCSPCEELVKHKFDCGHSQEFQCFSIEKDILRYKCLNQCQKKRSCGHIDPCENKCFNKTCSPCKQEVMITLNCSHIYETQCSKIPKDKNIIQCLQDCNKVRSCAHLFPCSKKCYEACSPCEQLVEHQFDCGHIYQFPCHSIKNDIARYKCSFPCQRKRICGHATPCLNLCSNEYCSPCTEIVETTLECGHVIKSYCYLESKGGTQIKCQAACIKNRTCGHNYPCQNKCQEACSLCEEKVSYIFQCGHTQQFKCFEYDLKVQKYVCMEKCKKQRKCGHNSPCLNNCSSSQCSICTAVVQQQLNCGHFYQVQCSQMPFNSVAIKCNQPCNRKRPCGHNVPCKNQCFYQCTPCTYIVSIVLECGHQAQIQCSNNKNYKNIQCSHPCQKERVCGHKNLCSNLCYQICSPCTFLVKKKAACGHEFQVECFNAKQNFFSYKCKESCNKIRSCGHDSPCENTCELSKNCTPCKVKVQTKLECGHQVELYCFQKTEKLKIICDLQCIKPRACGHVQKCLRNCNQPCSPCIQQVPVILLCGHTQPVPCFLQNNLMWKAKLICLNECQKVKKCGHSNEICKKKCFEPCSPCEEQINHVFPCGHIQTIKCYQLEETSCNKKCSQILQCQHECQNKCAQPCGPCSCIISKSYQNCGHTINIPCGEQSKYQLCNFLIQVQLKCGQHFKEVKCCEFSQIQKNCEECKTCIVQ